MSLLVDAWFLFPATLQISLDWTEIALRAWTRLSPATERDWSSRRTRFREFLEE